MQTETYSNPLIARYASQEMAVLWGEANRVALWRKLWVVLARSQQNLGLAITDEQIRALEDNATNIDFQKAAEYEKRFRHDVMAHVHAFGDVVPEARGIIHLGATSCYVTDNADLILMRSASDMILRGLIEVLRNLAEFARAHRHLPTLGMTHFQPAQLTTVGKRACLWIHDLLLDYHDILHRRHGLKLRGAKGTTGTQASFLALFDGDHDKVRRLDESIAKAFGFDGVYPVTGQTYSRKIDTQILDSLGGLAQSAHKLGTDLRLLAHRKEIEEPFEIEQIGSSAMPYKRNPMRSERLCGLARFLLALPGSAAQTAAVQWLERTLDDSAHRRLVIPQAFLAADALLRLAVNVTKGLVVHPQVIEKNVRAELPFMATENILMAAVKSGGDRQQLHERIRQHSLEAGHRVKSTGAENDLLDRLKSDPMFCSVDFASVLNPKDYVGRAPEQVEEFLSEHVDPILAHPSAESHFDSTLAV